MALLPERRHLEIGSYKHFAPPEQSRFAIGYILLRSKQDLFSLHRSDMFIANPAFLYGSVRSRMYDTLLICL